MIPFKAVLEDPSVVIVDEHSPHKFNAGLLVFRHTFLPEWWTKVFVAPSADLAILALCQLSRRRRSVSSPGVPALCGCPGVSGAVRRCPALSGALPRCPDAQSAPTSTITNPRPERQSN